MYKIMLVEDDFQIAQQVKKHLESWDYEVYCIEGFENVTEQFEQFTPQLVLMDISLPLHNGFYWCEKIRGISCVPIIFLSSASDNMNIITAMGAGADDFIAKPFDLTVLTAKIKALLRRSYDFAGQNDIIVYGNIKLDIYKAEVSSSAGSVQLTKNEFMILRTLLNGHGRIISRETLMQRLWETDSFVDENTLSVNVARLRKKLESIGEDKLIVTKVKMGYMIP